MKFEEYLDRVIEDLKERLLFREIKVYQKSGRPTYYRDKSLLNFSSNDYLGFSQNEFVKQKACDAIDQFGSSATSSRLVCGTLECHDKLEKALADFKGYEECIVFGSGFLANCGIIQALVSDKDIVIADKFVHASILFGVKLSGARLYRYHHNDSSSLERLLKKHACNGKCLVITESVFSMDGDLADLKGIVKVIKNYNALLMVDEAHATGIFGPGGRGWIAELGLENYVDICMGTLSKALGSYGGFVCCNRRIKEVIVNRAGAFIYTTALPPACCGAAMGALELLKKDERICRRPLELAFKFRTILNQAGLNTGKSQSHIVPVIIGDIEKMMRITDSLFSKGILVVPIRPPTVPAGTGRIRFSFSALHNENDVLYTAQTLIESARAEGII